MNLGIDKMINNDGICLISFSDNSDHQEIVYSLYAAMKAKARVYTVGIINPKASNPPKDKNNLYFDCPRRPGITKKTFRIDIINKIAGAIKKMKVRYVYFESMHIWNILLMIRLPKEIVCIEAVHDVLPHNNSFIRKECQRMACKLSSAVVLHNQMGIQDMMHIYKIPREKLHYITLWKTFPPERAANTDNVFLSFGRIRKYKGLDALEQIIAMTPHVTYQIVGSPDEGSRPQAEKLRRLPNVAIDDREVGVDEMEDYFTKASWIVLPYESASQSGVIIDAYRFSRPVIAFNVGAISEQIDNGKSGYLVPQGDINAFAETVRKAQSQSNEEMKAFCHNAYTFGKHLYGAEKAVDPFLKILSAVH